MNSTRILLCLPLSLMFGSCANNEYAYNEKAASLFLGEMRQVDDVHKSFSDSMLVFNADAGEVTQLETKAENIEKNAARDIQNMNDLRPSEAARDFHEGVVGYFVRIKNYGTTARQLLAASADEKKVLYVKLMRAYDDLNRMPDQVLEVQKRYMNKAGLKAAGE